MIGYQKHSIWKAALSLMPRQSPDMRIFYALKSVTGELEKQNYLNRESNKT